MDLDHVFIFTRVPEQAASALQQFGLAEGAPNTHPGQGTACRRFFFRNAYLELLWVCNEEEIKSPAIAKARLWERAQYLRTGYCPFGLCFKSTDTQSPAPLFEDGWPYRPPYLPGNTFVNVAANSDHPAEPMLFEMPFFPIAPEDYAPDRRQPLQHDKGFQQITGVTLTLPTTTARLSPALQKVTSSSTVAVVEGTNYSVALEFDDGKEAQVQDFTPIIPLSVRW